MKKKEHMLTMQDRKALFKSVQNQIRQQQQIVAKNALAKAESFLSKNKSENPGVIETDSGLQYKIIKEGTGKSPSSGMDQVRVQYEGKLIDGTIFDSSYEKGEPFVTRLNRVIKGWTEGIQLMKEGSEYEFFIHPKLAYGERRNNNIPPNSVLLFKVELEKVFEKILNNYILIKFCTPDRIRTCDPRIRNPVLYPAELPGQFHTLKLLLEIPLLNHKYR